MFIKYSKLKKNTWVFENINKMRQKCFQTCARSTKNTLIITLQNSEKEEQPLTKVESQLWMFTQMFTFYSKIGQVVLYRR